MAADSAKKAVHRALTATQEDVVTLTQLWDAVEVLNRHATGTLHATVNNTAVSALNQDDTYVLPPGQGIKVAPAHINGTCIVRLWSDAACEYSVTGVSA